MRARRPEDPRHFVLLEELHILTSVESRQRHIPPKVERRILSDDESVYTAQYGWKNNAGKFILMERQKAALQVSGQCCVTWGGGVGCLTNRKENNTETLRSIASF